MDIRVVTLRYSESLGGFPEEPLRQVLSGGNVIERRLIDDKAWLWALADDLREQLGTTRSLELKAERTLVAPC